MIKIFHPQNPEKKKCHVSKGKERERDERDG